jgi:hypothetical protein
MKKYPAICYALCIFFWVSLFDKVVHKNIPFMTLASGSMQYQWLLHFLCLAEKAERNPFPMWVVIMQ